MTVWKASQQWAGLSLPVPCCAGLPDAWPHIARMLEAGGFRHLGRIESIYAGRLESTPEPGDPPTPGVTAQRETCDCGVSFTAYGDGHPIGHCQCTADLTLGGRLPALRNWAELADMAVQAEYRNRRIGSWLVRHAVRWLGRLRPNHHRRRRRARSRRRGKILRTLRLAQDHPNAQRMAPGNRGLVISTVSPGSGHSAPASTTSTPPDPALFDPHAPAFQIRLDSS